MKTITRFLGTLALTAAVMAFATSVSAQQYGQYGQVGQYGQTGQYGQGVTPGQNIVVDKFVSTPSSTGRKDGEQAATYVDNLSINGEKYAPGTEVYFRIVVKNTSNQTLKNIVVTDTVPSFAEPLVGPGVYDATKRTVSYVIPELKAGAENVQYLKMKVFAQNTLPANQSVIEQTNKVGVSTNGLKDEDTAQYFIEKQVVGVSKVPDTGPELGLAFLALQGIGLAVGLKLRQHAS